MPTAIFTTDQAREFLGGNAGDLANESLVQEYIDAATLVIEDASRPAASDSRTFVVNGGQRAVLLPVPFVSVSSVTEAGQVLTATDYTADGAAGVIWRGASTESTSWASGINNVTVVVTVGAPGTIPANVTLAAKELLKHMWNRRQGPTRPTLQGVPGPTDQVTPAGYLVPNFVAALLAPSPPLPGFA